MAYTDEQKDEQRRHIAETCWHLIAEIGLQAVSARTLGKALGKTAGWVYTLYPDFDSVILAANSLTLAELDAKLTASAERHSGDTVAGRFRALALTYLRFSQEEPRRWAALFEHRMPDGRELPPEHKQEHFILFRHIEAPLSEVMPAADRQLLGETARTIYSAVHGVVSLGLQGRLDRVPLDKLERQLDMLTKAFAAGYVNP